MRKLTDKVLGIVRKVFEDPQKKKVVTAEIIEKAKPSTLALLAKKKQEVEEINQRKSDMATQEIDNPNKKKGDTSL